MTIARRPVTRLQRRTRSLPLHRQAESKEAALTDSRSSLHVRAIFLSDVHLGTRACNAEALLHFLAHHEADTIYLVGDIVDGWRLKSSWHWPQLHNDVVQKLLRKVRKGARLVYVPGNHDEFLRDYASSTFGGVEIVEEAMHRTLDGRRMLVLHGDKFDAVVTNIRWLALLGDWAYDVAIFLSMHISRARRRLGLPYWSFSAWSKEKVKRAVSYISDFENAVAADAARHGVDIVVCGHIHKPAMRQFERVLYLNTGDWIESCSAIVEHRDGRIELVDWRHRCEPPLRGAAAAPVRSAA
ncbi:MAG: UDP-2,3-diacylglucosamine diphosphatase [Methylobacteriaceae bacterium]|nr:UDP-2,3-diacylglucosamine diphosphatase [Methylobacteriaceae bacterium]